MKLAISYPPLDSKKGTPLLGQNRQFQYFHNATYIYPVIPATAATLLKRDGAEVLWNDCIAQGWSHGQFLDFMKKEKPDVIAMETKTPVVRQHWKIIDELKSLGTAGWHPAIVLFGDHVTALPEESFENSKVDYVLTGGDYDFLLANLAAVLEKAAAGGAAPPEGLEPGIWYRKRGEVGNTGRFRLDHSLDGLPVIDRDLTKWELYSTRNGNYKYLPGTYIMSGRDCWHHRCTFCSWTTLFPSFRTRKPGNVLDEVGMLIEKYRVKEIMDDTGAFPAGEWLREFCRGMVERGHNRSVAMDCNMRFGACSFDDYHLMKEAGFRLLLFGLESANQATLDRIEKRLTVEEIMDSCKLARKAGLYPHITIMFGYPWESYEEACRTLEMGKHLLKKGYACTVQATIVIPYPGTPLFEQCRKEGLLETLDWDRYDMDEPVMKVPFSPEKVPALVRGIYSVAFHPEFLYRKLAAVRDFQDLKYFLRGGAKVLGHLFDFGRR